MNNRGQNIVDISVWHVLVHEDLFDDHPLLFFYFFVIEYRIEIEVRNNVQSLIELVGSNFGIVTGELLSGKRVVVGTKRIELPRDITGLRPTWGALEDHMFQKV